MSGMLQKVLLILLLIPLLLLVFFIQTAELQYSQNRKGVSECYLMDRTISQQTLVFHNRKGLGNEIDICDPLRELTAIAPSKAETVEELIKDISIWIPNLYYQQFMVYPTCIIILETGRNDDGKAVVRFGVAMECTYKSRIADPLSI